MNADQLVSGAVGGLVASDEGRSENVRIILQAIAGGDINGLALTYLAAMARGFAAEERRHDEWALKRVAEEDAQLAKQKQERSKSEPEPKPSRADLR